MIHRKNIAVRQVVRVLQGAARSGADIPSLLATAGTTGARPTGGTRLHKCPDTHSHPEYDSSGDMDEGTARLYAHGHGGTHSVK